MLLDSSSGEFGGDWAADAAGWTPAEISVGRFQCSEYEGLAQIKCRFSTSAQLASDSHQRIDSRAPCAFGVLASRVIHSARPCDGVSFFVCGDSRKHCVKPAYNDLLLLAPPDRAEGLLVLIMLSTNRCCCCCPCCCCCRSCCCCCCCSSLLIL